MMSTSWAFGDVLRIHRFRYGDRPLGDHERRVILMAGGTGSRLVELTRRRWHCARAKQFCAFDDRGDSLLQCSVARWSRYVPHDRIHTVIHRRDAARAAYQLAGFEDIRVFDMPDDGGTGVAVIAALIDLLIEAPEATVMISPADQVVQNRAVYDELVADALRRAYFDQEIVSVRGGGEGWVSPIVVAKGRALLDALTMLAPRLVRLTLHCAAAPPSAEREMFTAAFTGLGQLDLHADMLPLIPSLRTIDMPRDAGLHDLDTERDVARWLLEDQRSQLDGRYARSRRGRVPIGSATA